MFLAKSKLKEVEVLTYKALINANWFESCRIFLINKVLREYDDMKEEIKNLKSWIVYKRF